MMTAQSITAQRIKHSDKLEMVKFGDNRFTIRFLNMPRFFMVTASAMAFHQQRVGFEVVPDYYPMYACFPVVFEFFSEDSTHHLKDITLYYRHKILGFDKQLVLATKTERLKDETATLNAYGMIIKTESYYSVVDHEGEHYVEQVPEIEEVRQIFLDNPELVAQIQQAAEREIEDGLRKGLYSTKLVKMMESLGGQQEGSGGSGESKIGEIARRLETSRELGARPKEGPAYALENLTKSAKGGNYCMVVIDGCWVNFQYKKKGESLYFQISGGQYIPKKSHFKDEHIALLKEIGIEAEEMSKYIFSRHFNDEPRDFNHIVNDVFRIFAEFYRVDDGASAYIEYVLGS